MWQQRHHCVERFDRAFETAGHVDDQRAAPHSGNAARKRGHGGHRLAGAPHQLANPRNLVVDDGCGGLRRDVARTQACASCRDDEVGSLVHGRHDRVGDQLLLVGHDLGARHLEVSLHQDLDHRGPALVERPVGRRAVADRDDVRPALHSFLIHVPERPPDFSSSLTDSRCTPRSTPLVMSISVSPATAAAVSASISTPVCPTTRALVNTRTPPSTNSKSTVTLVSGSGWHSGIRSEVFFAAMIPATRATWSASPLAVPSRTALTVSAAMRTMHSAFASRTVAILSATSTMRAAPFSSTWVNRFDLAMGIRICACLRRRECSSTTAARWSHSRIPPRSCSGC